MIDTTIRRLYIHDSEKERTIIARFFLVGRNDFYLGGGNNGWQWFEVEILRQVTEYEPENCDDIQGREGSWPGLCLSHYK